MTHHNLLEACKSLLGLQNVGAHSWLTVMSSFSLIFIRRQKLHPGNCNSDTESTRLHFLEVPCPPGQCSPPSFPPHIRILLGGRLFHHLSPLLSLYDSVSHHCPPPAHSSFYGGGRNMYTHTHTHTHTSWKPVLQVCATFQTVLSPVHQRTEPLWNNKLGHLPFLWLAGFWWWLRGVNLLFDVCVPQIKTSCFILSHELHEFLLCSWTEVCRAAQFTGWA